MSQNSAKKRKAEQSTLASFIKKKESSNKTSPLKADTDSKEVKIPKKDPTVKKLFDESKEEEKVPKNGDTKKGYDLNELFKKKLPDNADDYENYFTEVAEALLNHYILIVNFKHRFRVSEIAFYLRDEVHHDTFTHGDKI